MRAAVIPIGLFSAVLSLLVSSPAAFADHLDRRDTQRLLRRVEEQADQLQDHIDEWVDAHRTETHRLDEIYHAAEALNNAITDYRSEWRHHDEPWDLRDQARGILAAATDLGRLVNHSELSPIMRRDWEGMHRDLDEFARRYQLPPVEAR